MSMKLQGSQGDTHCTAIRVGLFVASLLILSASAQSLPPMPPEPSQKAQEMSRMGRKSVTTITKAENATKGHRQYPQDMPLGFFPGQKRKPILIPVRSPKHTSLESGAKPMQSELHVARPRTKTTPDK